MPTEPPARYWADKASYDAVLVEQFLVPLREAAARHGQAPRAEQLSALNRLHWYFTVDARPVAPTLVVDAPLAATFHRRVTDIMQFVAADALREMSPAASPEVRHALLSYKDVKGYSPVTIDAWDHEQGLARLVYWVHGDPPAERFVVDGRSVEPAFGKYRACSYFRRNALRQRIAWIPVKPGSTSLVVNLGGADAKIGVAPQPFDWVSDPGSASTGAPNEALRAARALYLDGRSPAADAPSRFARCKAWGLKALARTPFVRSRFRDAWVFVDREHDADDNAEHLYRWVTEHRPDINAWFLLKRGTADWARLERAGFRLVAPGLRRKLLLLNSAHVISSHPENAESKFDRRVYGDAMRWRFTYLKHGIVYNDLSHYYHAVGRLDCVVSPSPAEYLAFVGDDTPYRLTHREVRRCNAPRHDRLLQLASERGAPDEIVVMPTWRGRLIDDDLDFDERVRRMRSSEYAHAWRTLLNDRDLHELARTHGRKIVLVPHSNLIPYLQAFEVPGHVEVASREISIQEHFARCFAFITDYTSAAFDLALLRRHVLYFQFDRDQFFAGGHNWRPGYFDYERDGFGPVSSTVAGVAAHLRRMMGEPGASDEYLARMTRAMPDVQVGACAQIVDFIDELHRPFEQWGQADRTTRIGTQSTPRALRAM